MKLLLTEHALTLGGEDDAVKMIDLMAGNHSFKIGERILMHHTFSVFCVHLHAQRTLYLSDETRDAEASFIAFLFTDLADEMVDPDELEEKRSKK